MCILGECDHAKAKGIGVTILTGCKVAGMVGVEWESPPNNNTNNNKNKNNKNCKYVALDSIDFLILSGDGGGWLGRWVI